MCEFWKVNKCRKGAACSYAHGEEDLRLSPDFERTSVCPAFLKMGHCSNPSCRYAHSVDELRVAPNLLKSKMCSFFLDGRCVVGKACRFAHSVQELSQSAEVLRKATEDGPRPATGAKKEAVQAFKSGPRPLGLVADTRASAPQLSLRQQFAVSKVEERTPAADSKLVPSHNGHSVALLEQAKESMSPDGSPLLKLTQLTPADLEPMKVVVAASWEDDLQDSGEAVSSLKQRTSGRPPRSPRGEQKRPRARRVLVDTLADLDEFPTAVISSTSTSSLLDKGSEKCVLVNTKPGLIDLGSRHRESVVVLDIEEAMEVCRPGSDKFEQLQLVKIHQRQRARGRSEDPMRRTRRTSAHAPQSTKGTECSFRRENGGCGGCDGEPARAAAKERSNGSRPAAESEGNISQASRATDRREQLEQSCLLCQRESSAAHGCSSQTTPGQPCAACNCGLRVFQHNTFLTVAEEEDEEFQDLPIRRTKSM